MSYAGSPIYKDPQKYDIEFIDKNWDKHAHLLYRFSDNEHVGLPFKYKKNTKWVTLSREMISNNIQSSKMVIEQINDLLNQNE